MLAACNHSSKAAPVFTPGDLPKSVTLRSQWGKTTQFRALMQASSSLGPTKATPDLSNQTASSTGQDSCEAQQQGTGVPVQVATNAPATARSEQEPSKQLCYIVAGVSGSGKTTVGTLLARKLDCAFYDGDAFHPPENIGKRSLHTPE